MSHRSIARAVGAAVAVVLSSCSSGRPSAPDAAAYVQLGGSESDVALHASMLEQFQDSVLPTLEEEQARVVVAVSGDRTSTAPAVLSQGSYQQAVESAQGNGMVAAENLEALTDRLVSETSAGLTAYPPSPSSDPVSGLALATQVRRQMPSGTDFRVVLLGDAISTTESCNLLMADLSSPETRSLEIDRCTRGLIIDLRGVSVVMGGAGTDPDDVLTPERAGQIELFYRELIARFGGELRVYAAELVTEVA